MTKQIFYDKINRLSMREAWRYSQVVRQGSAKPLCPGSNPGGASNAPTETVGAIKNRKQCRCGETGRRKGLKIPRSNIRAGSNPASGTKKAGFSTCLFYALNFVNSDLAKSIEICVYIDSVVLSVLCPTRF